MCYMLKTQPIRVSADLVERLRYIADASRPRQSLQHLMEAALEEWLGRVEKRGLNIVMEPRGAYKTKSNHEKRQ